MAISERSARLTADRAPYAGRPAVVRFDGQNLCAGHWRAQLAPGVTVVDCEELVDDRRCHACLVETAGTIRARKPR
jgi:hypothetical protein